MVLLTFSCLLGPSLGLSALPLPPFFSHEFQYLFPYDCGCSPVPLKLANPNGSKRRAEQEALYVGSLCTLEVINTVLYKEFSITENYLLLSY